MKYSNKKMLKAVKVLHFGCKERLNCDNCILNEFMCTSDGLHSGLPPQDWLITLPGEVEAWDGKRFKNGKRKKRRADV